MTTTVLTLRQGDTRRDMIMSEADVERLTRIHLAHPELVSALRWIAGNAEAAPHDIRHVALGALKAAEAPFDA